MIFYSARYYSLFSNSFSEGSDVQDENGVYLGFTWIPAHRFILASLRPKDLLFHHRDINHMKMIVVHILAQSFGHCPVALIGVHHSGEDILFTAHDLHGGFVGIGIELFCKFIATVVVEVSGVHIEDQLAVFDGIRFQTSGGDHAVLFHLLKHFYIIVRGCFEMDVQRSAIRTSCRNALL